MRGQGGAWSLVCGLWAPGDPQFQRSLPVASGALSQATIEFPSYSWEWNMECKTKNDVEDGLENPEVDRDSKVEKTNDKSTITSNENDAAWSLLISAELPNEYSDARQGEASINDSTHRSKSLLVGKSKCSEETTGLTKLNFRFMPRPLQIHNKNLRVTECDKLRKSWVQSQVIADPMVTNVSNQLLKSQELTGELCKSGVEDEQLQGSIYKSVNTSKQDKHSQEASSCASTLCKTDVQDMVKSEVNVEYHEDPKPATQSSISSKDTKSNPDIPTTKQLSLLKGHKENEDPSHDPYEEFNNCRRHPDCKLTLEEVKGMADDLPSCAGIRLRVNYIRQIYKHGRDPDTWNWKQCGDIVPDYTFLLTKPISITKNVPHCSCKVTKRSLTKMSQSLPYAKSRKCFVYLCFYHGLDPDETLKRISENPLVPWVACPEPWRALESFPKTPEYPRVKEGYFSPKAPARSPTPPSKHGGNSTLIFTCTKSNPAPGSAKENSAISHRISENDSAVDPSCNHSNYESSKTEKASTSSQYDLSADPDAYMISSCSQPDPPSKTEVHDGSVETLPESEINSAAVASQAQLVSETRDATAVRYKTRNRIVHSEEKKAMDCSSSSTSCSPMDRTQSTPSGSMSRKPDQYQDLNPKPSKSQRLLMESGMSDSRSPAYNANHQFNGWYPQQQMGNFSPRFQTNQYPMAGNNQFRMAGSVHYPVASNNQYRMVGNNQYPMAVNNYYSSWNGYQAGGGYSPWNSPARFGRIICNQAGFYSLRNSSASFYGGGPPGNRQTLSNQLWNSSNSPGFTVDDVFWNSSSDVTPVNSGSFSSDSSVVPPKAVPPLSAPSIPLKAASAVSVTGSKPGLSADSLPSDSQSDAPLDSGDTCEDTPERVPLPPGTSFQEFLADWSRAVITPSKPSHSDHKSNKPGTNGIAPGSSSDVGDRPPPCGFPLSPSEGPPRTPSQPPLPSPPNLPPPPLPPLPPSPPPEEMDWMELGSTDHEHRQEFDTAASIPNIHQSIVSPKKAAHTAREPQKMPLIAPKFTIPKFTIPKRTVPKLTIPKLQFSKRPRKSSNSSDVAYKDPASSTSSSMGSSKRSEIDPNRRNIPVFVEPADYPISRLSDEQITLIENSILDAILDIDKNGVKPVFNESFRRNGRYLVVCSDDFSWKWLCAYLGTHKPWPNSNLRIAAKDFNEVRANAVLPICMDENNEKILKLIDKQNEELDVSKWEVVRRWETDDFKTCMDLVIDEKSAQFLENRSSIIFKMGTGNITLLKKPNSRALEDDIYADFVDDKSALELEKPTEFDSLEHDIYADFYGEKSIGIYEKAIFESNKDSSSDCSRLKSSFKKENSPRRSRERHRQDWLPPREEKMPKRQWSPKPGGGLCSREDPYVRREGVMEECQYRVRRTRWDYRSPSNGRQDPTGGRTSPSQTDRMEHSDDDEFPLRHYCHPRGSPSPCRCNDAELSMEDTTYQRPENSAPRSPTLHRSSLSHPSPETHRSTVKSAYPSVLSFQTQGFADEIFCPSPPKIEPWDDFTSPSRLLNNLKVEGSDIFGCNFQGAVRQFSEDVTDDHRDKDCNSSDSDSDHESKVSSISYQLGHSLQDIGAGDCKVEESKPIGKDRQDSVEESTCLPISIGGHIGQQGSQQLIESGLQNSDQDSKNPSNLFRSATNVDINEDSNPSVSDSHDSEESSDLSISFECPPGQSLQDVATEQFRKLVAAGCSCQKALQVTQAFVSKQLNSSPKPDPPKSPSLPPERTLHKVAADKFSQLVATGISHDKALEFTQAFIQRQMGLLPPADLKPLAGGRDTDLRVEENPSFPVRKEAEYSKASTSFSGCGDELKADETQTIDEWVDELL